MVYFLVVTKERKKIPRRLVGGGGQNAVAVVGHVQDGTFFYLHLY